MVSKLTITALHSAVKECRLKPAEDSIQQYGIPKNTKKTTDYLVLQTAVDKNHKFVAKLLINAGCRVKPNETEKDNGWTPLALAIIRGNLEIAMLLLNKGAGSEVGNKTGLTALHLAVRKKSLDMVRILLCHMSINLVDRKGHTVLQTFFQVVCNQVNPDQLDMANNVKILNLLLTKGASLNFANDPFGYTALHYAAKSKQTVLMNMMIQKIGDVNVASRGGDTPLHVLVSESSNYRRGVLDVVKLLVRNGANVNIANSQNETPLHSVLSKSHANEEEIFGVVQYLVERGANVNLQNFRSESACHIAARKKLLRVMNLFLQRRCQINLQDYEDNTILHRLLQNSMSIRENDAFIEIVNAVLGLGPALTVRNAEGRTPLDLIIQNKQARLLGRILAEDINVNAVDDNGNAVLHNYLMDLKEKNYKVDPDHVELIEILSTNGANVDLRNNAGKTPVQLALDLQQNEINSRERIFNMLVPLLNHSNDLDRVIADKGKTILHFVSHLKKPFDESEDTKAAEIVDLCLRRGATIDPRDSSQLTPLCAAVVNKQQRVARVLLEHDADPDSVIASSQIRVLRYLLKLEKHAVADVEIAGLLLSHGATIDESPESEFSILRYVTLGRFEMCSKLIAHSPDVEIVDGLGNTALHNLLISHEDVNDATEDKVCKVAIELILKGDLINTRNNQGLTPLHLAVWRKLRKVTVELLNHHANASALDNDGNCALHLFALKPRVKPNFDEDLEMVRLLTQAGCDVNTRNNDGSTALLIAARTESMSLVRALIKRKADVNLCTNEFAAPLHTATEYGRTKMTEYLLKYGADVNARKSDGKTALHVAVELEKVSIVEILLRNGADVNMRDSGGRTALSLACWHSKLEMVRRLLKSGADVNSIDDTGKVPLQLSQGIVQMELSRHIRKLSAAGMLVSPENQRMDLMNDALYGQFEKEMTRLKDVKIGNQNTLADVLLMNERRSKTLKSDEEFQKHINAEDLHERFPHYADLLKACHARGAIRSDLAAQAKISLREMIEIPLPDICCDLLFGFLGNESLQDLVTAGRLKNKARKRRRDEDDDEDDGDVGNAPPGKRQRRVSV